MKYLAVIFCAIAVASAMVIYQNYKVYHVIIETEEQFHIMEDWRLNDVTVDFWQLSHAEHYADIMVGPEVNEKFLENLASHGFKYTVANANVQDTIDHLRQ